MPFFRASEATWPGEKPAAPSGSLLAENLQTVLRTIQARFERTPETVDVVLYLYDGASSDRRPTGLPDGFWLVCIDCGPARFGNYIRL